MLKLLLLKLLLLKLLLLKLLMLLRLWPILVALVDVGLRLKLDHLCRRRLCAPPASFEIFDSFYGEEEPLLVPELVEPDVLQVLDGDLGDVFDGHVALAPKLGSIF